MSGVAYTKHMEVVRGNPLPGEGMGVSVWKHYPRGAQYTNAGYKHLKGSIDARRSKQKAKLSSVSGRKIRCGGKAQGRWIPLYSSMPALRPCDEREKQELGSGSWPVSRNPGYDLVIVITKRTWKMREVYVRDRLPWQTSAKKSM